MKLNDIFINGKKYSTKNKTRAQLEHMLQLARDEVRRYEEAIKNYPPDRMEKHGKPFLARLKSYVNEIQQAIENQA